MARRGGEVIDGLPGRAAGAGRPPRAISDPSDARAKLIERTERGWTYQAIAAGVVADLEQKWSELLGAADFEQMKSHLARLAFALGVNYRGSVAEAGNRAAGR